MGVKVREHRGALWLFIDHDGKRKARRVGAGKVGKKAAELAAVKIQARLAEGNLSALEPEGAPGDGGGLYEEELRLVSTTSDTLGELRA